jgi:hypothetical protein
LSSAINAVATAEASQQLWDKCINLLELFADEVFTHPLSQTLRLEEGGEEIFVQSFTPAMHPESDPAMYQVRICPPGATPERWQVSLEEEYETHILRRDFIGHDRPDAGEILQLCQRLDRALPAPIT